MLQQSNTKPLCGRLRKGTGFDHANRHQARRDDGLLLGSGARVAGGFCFPRVSVEARMSFDTTASKRLIPASEKQFHRLPADGFFYAVP